MAGITNAKDLPLSFSSLPNVSGALDSWFQSMVINSVAKTTIDFKIVEILTPLNLVAVKQPFKSRDLMIKPEGQRAWNWFTLHVKAENKFEVDDVVMISGVKYRIMNKWDWNEYGYFEYHMIEDYDQTIIFATYILCEDGSYLNTEDGRRVLL